MSTVTDRFKNYAWFSVQVDQYYAAIKILSRHYGPLKQAYRALPKGEDRHPDLSSLSDAQSSFYISAASALNHMGTTHIYDDAPFESLGDLPEDMLNFGFYTCFCFQWTLFENFVKESTLDLGRDGLLSSEAAAQVCKLRYQTEKFLCYIDSGAVFGHSPFVTLRYIPGWVPKTEHCNYSDLNEIRSLRNEFIHGVQGPSILPESEVEKERRYGRSMDILRAFAGNVDQDVIRVRNSAKPAANS
jgi:hypothetical protein